MLALREMTAIALVILVSLTLSQLPNFIQEYEQRLGGALGEVSRQLTEYEHNANREGLTFQEYLRRHVENPEPIFQRTGHTIDGLARRRGHLEAQAQALQNAPKWMKPLLLVWNFDRDFDFTRLQATWEKFEIRPVFDPTFGLIGVVIGWLLHTLFWMSLPRRRIAKEQDVKST